MAPRRLRLTAFAALVSVVFLYSFWSSNTWPSLEIPAYPTGVGVESKGGSTSTKAEVADTLNSVPNPSSGSESAPLATPSAKCLDYQTLQRMKQEPLSEGKRQFPYSRPDPECRTFQLPSLEKLIERMRGVIKDPDLFRLFENSFPNTLDTMIKWRGYARGKANKNLFSMSGMLWAVWVYYQPRKAKSPHKSHDYHSKAIMKTELIAIFRY